MTRKTKKCPNCGKETYFEIIENPEFDSVVYNWRLKCLICQKGCYEGNYDFIPGRRDYYEEKCCFCGATKEDRRKNNKFHSPIGKAKVEELYFDEAPKE
mgnify:CR=1 FL=1|jgi:hypothetical protein